MYLLFKKVVYIDGILKNLLVASWMNQDKLGWRRKPWLYSPFLFFKILKVIYSFFLLVGDIGTRSSRGIRSRIKRKKMKEERRRLSVRMKMVKI